MEKPSLLLRLVLSGAELLLEQWKDGTYRVTYDEQRLGDRLCSEDAAQQVGMSLLHALMEEKDT